MADRLRNFGLEKAFAAEKDMDTLVTQVLRRGKVIKGYSGTYYAFRSYGDVEFWAAFTRNETGQFVFRAIHSHCANMIAWQVSVLYPCTQPEDDERYNRLVLVSDKPGGDEMIPIEIVNSDILPSLQPGEDIRLQMIALPDTIHYYADEASFRAAQSSGENAADAPVVMDRLHPVGYLANHELDDDELENDTEHNLFMDAIVQYQARVKRVRWGRFGPGEEKQNTFVRVFADTQFGEIEFDHAYDQVDAAERANIRVGSIIAGVCVLCGDAAIYAYENGAPQNAADNLRLIRSVLMGGEAERLRKVLSPGVYFETASENMTFFGADEVIERLQFEFDNFDIPSYVYYGQITDGSMPGLEYKPGTECLAVAYSDIRRYEALVFVESDEEGMITGIRRVRDMGYRFNTRRGPRGNEDTPKE